MSRSARALSALNAPVDSWEPTHATPNLAPSSSENATTATGTRGAPPRSRTISMAAKADTTPSGPSNAPPSGTESRCEPVTNAPVGSPDQPGGVHHDIHATLGAAAGEPLPQRQVGVRPCVAPVPAGGGMPADVQNRRPEGVERGHAFSRIGIRTPRVAAMSA